jgi:hypothetical protein
LLKQEGFEEPEAIARDVESAFEQYPYWRISAQQERDVRRALVKILVAERAKAKSENRQVRDTREITKLIEKILRVAGRAQDVGEASPKYGDEPGMAYEPG